MCASASSATQLRDLALGLRGCGGGEGTLAAASAARPAAPDAQRDIAATDGSEPSPVPRPPAKQQVPVTQVSKLTRGLDLDRCLWLHWLVLWAVLQGRRCILSSSRVW